MHHIPKGRCHCYPCFTDEDRKLVAQSHSAIKEQDYVNPGATISMFFFLISMP